MGRQDQNHVFLKMARPYMVLLQDGVRSPFYDDDVERAGRRGRGRRTRTKKDKKDDEAGDRSSIWTASPTASSPAPGVEADNYFRLEAIEGGFLMLRKDEPEFLKYQNVERPHRRRAGPGEVQARGRRRPKT